MIATIITHYSRAASIDGETVKSIHCVCGLRSLHPCTTCSPVVWGYIQMLPKLVAVSRQLKMANMERLRKILSSDGLADVTEEVYQEMMSKHPPSPPNDLEPPFPSSTPSITTPTLPASTSNDFHCVIPSALVSHCIKSFPNGTSPGPSALRASHLKEAMTCPSNKDKLPNYRYLVH